VGKDRKQNQSDKMQQLERNGEDADGQMLTTNQGCWLVIVRIH